MNGLMSLSIRHAFTKYLQDKNTSANKEINLDLALKAFITNENNRVHLITKEVPNRLVLTNDKNLIQTVKQRILDFYSKRNKKVSSISLKKGMRMFITRKVNADRKKKILMAVKEGIFAQRIKVKIPVEITSTAKLSRNLINVRVRNGNFQIPPGVYTINTQLLSVANSKAWEIISNKN